MALSLYLTHASEPDLFAFAHRPDLLGGRLRASSASRDRRVEHLGRDQSSRALALGRSWHVLHGLLAGSPLDGPRPASTLLAGGREIGPDLGHGRPRIASPDETRAFAAYVAPLCPHRLKSGIDPRRVARTRWVHRLASSLRASPQGEEAPRRPRLVGRSFPPSGSRHA